MARHELFHAVQHLFNRNGQSFLNAAQITVLVHCFIDDQEVMVVISRYPSEEVNSALDAHLVSRSVPNELMGGALLAGRIVQQVPQQGPIGSLRADLLGG